MPDHDDVMFSRTQGCALGKCTTEIKVMVPEELRDAIAGLAAVEGKTISEYCRDLYLSHAFGHLHALRMARHGKKGMPE